MSLTREQLSRYGRHLTLAPVGEKGQEKLLNAKVLILGAGGLGCPAALYLAAAGVGTIGLADFDTVDLSNLQRQILYTTRDIGRRKVDVATEVLTALNPDVSVIPHPFRVTRENVLELFSSYDLVLDGTDNFSTRYLVNDACVLSKIPNIYGSILRFEGQASIFCAERGPCYRCLFPTPPDPGEVPNCAEAGVFGALPGQVASIQAMEAIKWITGAGSPLVGRLMLHDALAMDWRVLKISPHPDCPVCGKSPSITRLDQDYDAISTCAVPGSVEERRPLEAQALLASDPSIRILDVRTDHETAIAALPGAIHIPLQELPKRMGELPGKEVPYLVMCHHGMRSRKAATLLTQKGYKRLINLNGGIDAWAKEIDPRMEQY